MAYGREMLTSCNKPFCTHMICLLGFSGKYK